MVKAQIATKENIVENFFDDAFLLTDQAVLLLFNMVRVVLEDFFEYWLSEFPVELRVENKLKVLLQVGQQSEVAGSHFYEDVLDVSIFEDYLKVVFIVEDFLALKHDFAESLFKVDYKSLSLASFIVVERVVFLVAVVVGDMEAINRQIGSCILVAKSKDVQNFLVCQTEVVAFIV